MSDDLPVRCKCRKQSITSLRCTRCFVPICPDCSKPAPVGMLCRQCVHGKTHLTEISGGQFGKGFLAGLGVAIFCGWILASFSRMGVLGNIWGGVLYGLAVAEACLRASGHKRGWKMEVTAGGCALFGIVAGWFIHAMAGGTPPEEGWLLSHLLSPFTYLLMGLAVLVAVYRMKSF